MPDFTPEEADAFLAELTELTRRHGLAIWGCGCCGSPSLIRVTGKGKYREWLEEDHHGFTEGDITWEDDDGMAD